MTDTKRLVMVCGAARSGTTMLDLMLGNADDAFSCGEIYALFRPFRKHHFDPVCSCGDQDCEVWRELQYVPESKFHRRILEDDRYRFVVDSSKDLRWVVNSNEWATADNVPVTNLLLWKEPVDLAHSHWKRGRPIDYFRKAFLDYYERFLDLELPCIAINYPSLVGDPQVMLEKVCARIGMDYFPGKEEFWHKEHHHFFGSAGTAKQVDKGESKVGLQRDFPAEFNQAWGDYTRQRGEDLRLQSVVDRLRALDIDAPEAAELRSGSRPGWIRPLWYYRHALKAVVRRHYPERAQVVD